MDARAISIRRRQYRPGRVDLLLVGESAPAGGTHYYLANSRLFGAVREAFVRVYGVNVPDGKDFLSFAQDHGLWLVDLAAKPVNRLSGSARSRPVAMGSKRVGRQIRETDPAFVVAIKATIFGDVRDCLAYANSRAEFVGLPFPVMQWRAAFVQGLATVLRRVRSQGRIADAG
jgi:hypothetical protein